MDVLDVILKLQGHCNYPASWNNKVVDDVVRVFKYLLKAGKKHSANGRLHLFPGRQNKFHIEIEP